MNLTTAADWLTWGGLVLPLVALAWSARQYVEVQKEQQRQRNFENFFSTIMRVHNADRALISQKAAIFELRNYPHYKELVIRICDEAEELFPNIPDTLKYEFKATSLHIRKNSQ